MKIIKLSPYLFFFLFVLLSSCEKEDYITDIVNYKNSYNAESAILCCGTVRE